MSEEERDLPTTNQPLHGERRPLVTPIVAVVALVVGLVALMLFLIWLTRSAG